MPSSVLGAWLKVRTVREKQVFSELFEQSFLAIYTWGTQNCEFMMEVLQCNIIQQLLFILDGLIPYSKDVEQAATTSIAGSNEGEIKNVHNVPCFFFHHNWSSYSLYFFMYIYVSVFLDYMW